MNLNKFIKQSKLKIIVKPNSPKNEIIKWDKNKRALKVNIKAKAENNKANIEIIKYFSKLTKNPVKIVYGLKSKQKIL